MNPYVSLLKETDDEQYWESLWNKFSTSVDNLCLKESTESISLPVEEIRDMLKYESLFTWTDFTIDDVIRMTTEKLLESFCKRVVKQYGKSFRFKYNYDDKKLKVIVN